MFSQIKPRFLQYVMFTETATYTNSSFHSGAFFWQSCGWILWRLKGRFGFDRWRGPFGFGDSGASVGTNAIPKQLTNHTLLIAFSVGGGNYLQTDNWGMHCLTEDFLGSWRKMKRDREWGETLVHSRHMKETSMYKYQQVCGFFFLNSADMPVIYN